MTEKNGTLVVEHPAQLWRVETRRGFLRMLGVGGTVVLLPSVFAACDDDPVRPNPDPDPDPVSLNLSTDVGILNYAFALEQLEAAFYTAVLGSTAFAGLSADEREVLTDLRNHEVIHREFFRRAIPAANRIGDLELNMATVNAAIGNRLSILRTAEQFEDLGVAAYNGAGKYLTSADNLLIAGKIVSVEARHAAAIRDLREGMSLGGTPANTRFAGDDVVNAQGLDVKLEPAAVLTRVNTTEFVEAELGVGTGPTGTATPDQAPPNTP